MVGTGCATKKYVAKTVDPVEKRVTGTESKNTDQDKELASQNSQIQELDKDLSRTKERLGDVDNKATAAGQAAKNAGDRAEGALTAANGAQTTANSAQTAANGVRTYAEKLERTMVDMNKFQLMKAETVLFPFNQAKLSTDGKQQLADLAKMTDGLDRYVIEVQGFTDKSGTPSVNEALSQQRAQEVARYLVNEYKVPVRDINTLGSGYATPVADDKTRDGRKLNRRVEVRLYVPVAEPGGTRLQAKEAQ
jgi:outer membrane protein OmpA-like peptidoglycan-associated protein